VGKGRDHIPIRTCISCGAKRSKRELIRLVIDQKGELVRDDSKKAQGKAAYVCDRESCQKEMIRNRRFVRAFKGKKIIRISPALTLSDPTLL
jgi:predicted RNA-binding protein YlxR (DUF448 family)